MSSGGGATPLQSALKLESDIENSESPSPDKQWVRANNTDIGMQDSTVNNGSLRWRSEKLTKSGRSRSGASFKKSSQILQKVRVKELNIEDNLVLGSSRIAYNSMVDMMLLNNENLQFNKVKKQMEIQKKIHKIGRRLTRRKRSNTDHSRPSRRRSEQERPHDSEVFELQTLKSMIESEDRSSIYSRLPFANLNRKPKL